MLSRSWTEVGGPACGWARSTTRVSSGLCRSPPPSSQEVHQTQEALPALRRPRQGEAEQLGPVLMPSVSAPACRHAYGESMGFEEELSDGNCPPLS